MEDEVLQLTRLHHPDRSGDRIGKFDLRESRTRQNGKNNSE
jgi:hypothetical protein